MGVASEAVVGQSRIDGETVRERGRLIETERELRVRTILGLGF
jgi:hypothetical protein